MISFCLIVGKWELSFMFGEAEPVEYVEELEPTSVAGDYEVALDEDEPVTGFGRPGTIRG